MISDLWVDNGPKLGQGVFWCLCVRRGQPAVPQPPPDVRSHGRNRGGIGVPRSRTTLTEMVAQGGLVRLINVRSPVPSISVGVVEGWAHVFANLERVYR